MDELEQLKAENAELKQDIRQVVRGIKKALTELKMVDDQGNFEFNTRQLMRIVPLALNGGLNDKLGFLSELKDIIFKYKDL